MSNEVYANNQEVACKAADGKSICCFPDVCMTPPENPATPPGVPVPYPNTGMASDTTDGSRSVQISGKEVMLKNKSYFTKSMGDEAGCAAKKGVVTSVNRGKIYFIAWSMDVKVEAENVVRHLDMTTHNHASPASNTAPWSYTDRQAIAAPIAECATEVAKVDAACKRQRRKDKVKCPCGGNVGAINRAKAIGNDKTRKAALIKAYNGYANCMNTSSAAKCTKAARCMLTEKRPNTCCAPQTPHHIVPGSQFRKEGTEDALNKSVESYKYDKAACICVEGESQTQGSHGAIHFETATQTKALFPHPEKPFSGRERWKVSKAEEVGANAVNKEFGCNVDCIKAQVRQKHKEMGIDGSENIRPTAPAPAEDPKNDSTPL
jgi:hypothetical protein